MADITPIGRGAFLQCDLTASDYLTVMASQAEVIGKCVTLSVTEVDEDDGESTMASVVVTLPHARALAAAILNQADLADGTTPLLFHPVTPDGVEGSL